MVPLRFDHACWCDDRSEYTLYTVASAVTMAYLFGVGKEKKKEENKKKIKKNRVVYFRFDDK